jgi:hypothetical protein
VPRVPILVCGGADPDLLEDDQVQPGTRAGVGERPDDQMHVRALTGHLLAKENRERISLLAGGAAQDPEAHLSARVSPLEESRNDLLCRHQRFRERAAHRQSAAAQIGDTAFRTKVNSSVKSNTLWFS